MLLRSWILLLACCALRIIANRMHLIDDHWTSNTNVQQHPFHQHRCPRDFGLCAACGETRAHHKYPRMHKYIIMVARAQVNGWCKCVWHSHTLLRMPRVAAQMCVRAEHKQATTLLCTSTTTPIWHPIKTHVYANNQVKSSTNVPKCTLYCVCRRTA